MSLKIFAEKEATPIVEVDAKAAQKLIRFNFIMAIFHFIQGTLMVILSNGFKLPVLTNFLDYDVTTKSALPSAEKFVDIRIGYAVASFLFMSSLAHFLLCSPFLKNWYITNLRLHRNYARWIEYAFSSSLMIVIIAMLCGIYDLASLMGLFGLNALMNLFGLLMERNYSKNGKADWLVFFLGCLAGMIPWIVIIVYFLGAASNADAAIPGFVYAILISLFITFNIFAINMYLQYKKVGKWKSYLFGEVAFIVLSLFAKSLLAWQVFSGTLR